jgi:acyl-CoA synthetase (AMP-forming)/AMP-acid ligase II
VAATFAGASTLALGARGRRPLRLGMLWRSRMVRPMRPDKLVRTMVVVHRWGLTPAAAYGLAAIRHPDRLAIVDEHGAVTFAEAQRRTNSLANALAAAGIGEQDTVAIMCRNHRGFVEATVACSKLGANVLCLDTALSGPRIAALLDRAAPGAVIYDEEFSALMPSAQERCKHFIAWSDAGTQPSQPLLEELIAAGDKGELCPPRSASRVAILSAEPGGSRQRLEPHVSSSLVLAPRPQSPIPLKRGETTMMAAPLCHPWGFLHLKLALGLGSTLVLHRRFDAQATLSDVARHRATALAVLPDMLRRIVGLGAEPMAGHQTSSLRLIAIDGPSVAEELAMPAMERFGDVLYNLHGPSVVKLDGRSLGLERRRLPACASRARRAHGDRRVPLGNHARRPH